MESIYAQPLQVYLLSPSWPKVESIENQEHAPKDFLSHLQQLVVSIYQLIHPANGISLAKSKKHKMPNKNPPYHKLVLDRLGFGNLSFNLGFTLNFQLSNSVEFNRQLNRIVLKPETMRWTR